MKLFLKIKTCHGAFLIPEGLELGELKIEGTADFDDLLPVAIIAYSRNPHDDGFTQEVPTAQGVIANGIPNGMYFCIASFNYLQGVLQTINNAGYGEAILTIFTVPAFSLIGFNNWTLQDITSGVLWWFVSSYKAQPVTKTLLSRPSSIDGYTPRNAKLLQYPYLYLGFNPQNGSQKIYRYENFTNGTPVFKMYSEINQNPLVCFVPQNYRGQANDNTQDMATMQGYPTLGWITDVFNTWLAQNSEILSLQQQQEQYNYEINAWKQLPSMLGNEAQIGLSGDYGKMAGGFGNLISSAFDLVAMDKNHEFYIANMMAQREKQSLLPNTGSVSGSNATMLGYDLIDNNIFTRYSIKRDAVERIDKFFDMYGYTINELKSININTRSNWNYIKTQGANLLGDIPQFDLQTLKEMFDNGITFWHNPETFLDYSQTNS